MAFDQKRTKSKVWGLVKKEVSYAHQCCILFDQKYSKNKNIVKYYYNLNKLFSILIWMEKLHFQQYSVSHDPLEIILIC